MTNQSYSQVTDPGNFADNRRNSNGRRMVTDRRVAINRRHRSDCFSTIERRQLTTRRGTVNRRCISNRRSMPDQPAINEFASLEFEINLLSTNIKVFKELGGVDVSEQIKRLESLRTSYFAQKFADKNRM